MTGEIALGSLSQRQQVLGLLSSLPQAEVASASEVATFIEQHRLYALGIGYVDVDVDVELLAATRLTVDARLWTRDTRLAAAAVRLELVADPPGGTTTP